MIKKEVAVRMKRMDAAVRMKRMNETAEENEDKGVRAELHLPDVSKVSAVELGSSFHQ